MRILLVSHSANDPNAGASRVYHLLCSGLQERGHTVKCLHLEDLGLPHSRLPARRLLIPYFASRAAEKALQAGFDLVMCSNGMLYPLYRRLQRNPNRPLLVQHYHGLSLFDHQAIVTEAMRGHLRPSLAYRFLTARLPIRWDELGAANSDLVIVQNNRDADVARRYTRKPASTIALALQPEIAQASEFSVPMKQRSGRELVWFGSWSPRKGCMYLPEAFDRVAQTHPDVTLTIGGTGKGDSLKDLFHPASRSRITVLPHISLEEQVRLFNRGSIFLFPSLSEGFGFALLEALDLGMACVSTQTGIGADWLQDRVTALLVPPASGLHLAQAIDTLLNDPGLREKLSSEGKALARQFTVERMLSSYEQVFQESLSAFRLNHTQR